LPGLPFVYYGEEIGMTGDKPDERLRTPMQWSDSAGLGFTRGTPWEEPQPDWRTTNVSAQETDSTSLLALYRRLIHLRAEKSALGSGDLVPLTTNDDRVAAYVRREGNQAVMVIANLGASGARGVTLASVRPALPPGSYSAARLIGTGETERLTVDADGRIRGYVPFATLAPLEAIILELSHTP
jgi:glycosidase